MNIEGKRALLQRAMDEGLEVKCLDSGPKKIKFAGLDYVLVTDSEGNEYSWRIGGNDWRIIEKPKMTVGYRRFVKNAGEGREIVDTCLEGAKYCDVYKVQSWLCFIRWIDHEWQYEPVEQYHEH